jgi:hypothetical protein
MPKDHYVPRHYLRQFSIAGSELIAVTTLSPHSFLGAKGIGGQCQEDDFEEGNAALGKLLGRSESDIAPVLVRVAQTKTFTEPELTALQWLTVILHLRTRKAAEAYKIFPKRIFYEVIKDGIDSGALPPPPEGEWTEKMVACNGVTAFLLRNTIACSMEMRTLACKILGAPSGSHFITSDNPVVVLNQFCADVEPHRNFAGFGRAGFQALLPISPKLSLLFYDAKVYKVGSRRHSLVEVSKADVEIINSLQIQSAENRVYFHDTKLAREVEDLIALYGNLRIPVEDFLRTIPGKNPNEELWHFRAPSVRLPRTWSYCRLRRRINLRIGERRDPAWSALIEEVGKDFEQNPNGGDLPARVAKIIADPNSLKNIRVF